MRLNKNTMKPHATMGNFGKLDQVLSINNFDCQASNKSDYFNQNVKSINSYFGKGNALGPYLGVGISMGNYPKKGMKTLDSRKKMPVTADEDMRNLLKEHIEKSEVINSAFDT